MNFRNILNNSPLRLHITNSVISVYVFSFCAAYYLDIDSKLHILCFWKHNTSGELKEFKGKVFELWK